MYKNALLLLGMWAGIFLSCTKTDLDPNNPPNTSDAVFRCKVDGVLFDANALLIAGLKTESAGFYSLSANGTFFDGGDTINIIVTVSGNDFSDVADGATFTGAGTVLDMVAIGNYSVNSLDDVDASSLETGIATIHITSIDKTEEVFSGTFSFEAEDPSLGDTYVFTEGVFENVDYR